MNTHFSFEAIGTHWNIDIFQDCSQEQQAGVFALLREKIESFEKTYSRFRTDSWVAQIANQGGTFDIPPDGEEMISLYRDLYQITNGLVTPLIGGVLVDAGYDKDYSLEQKRALTTPPAWDEVITYEPPHITFKQPVKLDFGGIGKGYLIDLVSQVIESQGITNYTVDAGGDMKHFRSDGETLRVGLEDPENTELAIGIITLENQSLAGSAGNRRAWKNFNHIINPKTLKSSDEILAIWVVADSTKLADALTTALYFCDPVILEQHYSFKYLIVYHDRSVTGTLVHDSMVELF